MTEPITIEIPAELVESIARRAAEIAAERSSNRADGWAEWMNVETAACYMDVSVERVRKLIARKALPSYSEGKGCRRFLRRSEIDACLAELREGGAH